MKPICINYLQYVNPLFFRERKVGQEEEDWEEQATAHPQKLLEQIASLMRVWRNKSS